MYWHERDHELSVLCDQRVRDILVERRVELVSFATADARDADGPRQPIAGSVAGTLED
jgi:hypothetical protein